MPAASAIAGEPIDYALALWHGFTPMLALSVLTVVLGVLALRRWDTLRPRLAAIAGFERLDRIASTTDDGRPAEPRALADGPDPERKPARLCRAQLRGAWPLRRWGR